MNVVNLYHYISQGLFFKNQTTQKSFDIIIAEKTITNAPSNFISLESQNLEFGISWLIASFAQSHKNILVILDSLNLFYLIPLFKKLPKTTNITILNLGAWASSAINKEYPELEDISIAKTFQIPLYDTIDLLQFFKILSYKQTKIIRIPNLDLPTNISNNFQIKSFKTNSIIGPDQTLIEWGKINIITEGYFFATLLQINEFLIESHKISINGFLINNRDFKNLENLSSYLNFPTIFIIDQNVTPLLESYLTKIFKKVREIITPQLPSTIQAEWIWPQAKLSSGYLIKKIIPLITK